MNYQRILPEGWNNIETTLTLGEIDNAWQTGKIMQAKVTKCDSSSVSYTHLTLPTNCT